MLSQLRPRNSGLVSKNSRTRQERPYRQLDHAKRQIRILRLLPGLFDDQIRCVVYTAYLDDKPYYEALSYVWGDPERITPIVLNGCENDITTNLWAALRRLRRRFSERHLWVDALCINQKDSKEKSHQVNLMKDIYSNTAKAILWLGDFSDAPEPRQRSRGGSSSFCSLVKAEVDVFRPLFSSNPNAVMPRKSAVQAFKRIKSMATDKHWTTKSLFSRESSVRESFEALKLFMRLPWWNRIWTVQEAILPKHAVIVFGTEQMPLEEFLLGYKNCAAHIRQGCCENFGLNHFWDTCHRIRYVRNREPSNTLFITALSMFRTRQSTDRRDHVFALLGLGGTIAANYSTSWETVFVRATRKLIADSGELLPLLRTSELKRSPNLPSWVPDWSAGLDEGKLDSELAWLYNWSHFDAAAGIRPISRDSISDVMLELRGMMVDRVSEVSNYTDSSSSDERNRSLAEWQAIIDQTAEKHNHHYPYGGSYADAFWRSVMVDIVVEPRDDGTVNYRRSVPADTGHSQRLWSPDYEGMVVIPNEFLRGFVTHSGMVGFGPRHVEVGDEVWLLLGGRMPFVLRSHSPIPQENMKHFKYIGQTYIHGIMDGQAINKLEDLEWICIE